MNYPFGRKLFHIDCVLLVIKWALYSFTKSYGQKCFNEGKNIKFNDSIQFNVWYEWTYYSV